jgi:hypothetical protein
MYYEINVSKHGKHYFATHERSFNQATRDAMKTVYEDFVKRFPKSEGFEISVTHYSLCGEKVEFAPKIQTLEEMEKENHEGFRNP